MSEGVGERILTATAALLKEGGVEAVSTRAVAARAAIQPPTIYRQFGDKDGLLDATALHVLRKYMAVKRRVIIAETDPIDALRRLWDLHVEFGLKRPEVYTLIYGSPLISRLRPAAQETVALLRDTIGRIGESGALAMSVQRATQLVHSAGVGLVLTTIPVPPAERDPDMPTIVRENTVSAIVTGERPLRNGGASVAARAVALAESVREHDDVAMTAAERALLIEWLGRLADHAALR